VEEVSEQVMQLRSVARRSNSANYDILLTCIAMKQYRECREKRHERRGSFCARQRINRIADLLRYRKRLNGPMESLQTWSRVIGWEAEHRHSSGKLLPPIAQVL